MCQSRGRQSVFLVCIHAMWYCLLDNGCQDLLLFSIGQVEMLSIFGSLHKISVGLSALKQNLKHSGSAKGRCNRSHYANACFVCCRAVKINTRTQTHTGPESLFGSWVEGVREPTFTALYFIAFKPPKLPKLLPIPPLNLTSVSKRINMEISSISGINQGTLTSH